MAALKEKLAVDGGWNRIFNDLDAFWTFRVLGVPHVPQGPWTQGLGSMGLGPRALGPCVLSPWAQGLGAWAHLESKKKTFSPSCCEVEQ